MDTDSHSVYYNWISFFCCITKKWCQKRMIKRQQWHDGSIEISLLFWRCFHVIVFVAASYPVIKSIATDDCILEGQNVSLTCQVTYNGTNLMPLVMYWYKYAWYSGSYRDVYAARGSTVNVSSVHQSSLTFPANTTDIYKCVANCTYPTGLIVPGVQEQSRSMSGTFWSSPFVSNPIASKTTTIYMSMLFR